MDRIEITEEVRAAVEYLRDVAHAVPEFKSGLPQFPKSLADCFRIKDDPLFALGTSDLIITLEPTERLMELIAAKRTGEVVGKVSTEL